MLNKLIEGTLQQKFLIILTVCAIIGLGIFCLKKLPIDAVPDISPNQVQINTEVP
nr:hypothetical protein [Escherichia coli]